MFLPFTLDHLTTWTTTVLLIVLLSIWMYRRYTFWSSQGMAGPQPIPLLGNLLDYFLKPMYIVDMERQKKYGQIFGTYLGFNLVVNISSPQLIKKTMISDFFAFHGRIQPGDDQLLQSISGKNGQEWKDQRTIMSQAFTFGKTKKMLPIIKECCESFSGYLDTLMVNGKTNVDLMKLYSLFIMNLTAKVQFGIHVKGYLDESSPMVHHAFRFFNIPKTKLLLNFFIPKFIKEKLGISLTPKDSQEFLVSAAKEILRQRRDKSCQREYPDLLQLLSEASVDNNDVEDTMPEFAGFKKTLKKTLTEKEIIANIMTFFVVGFDSTANVLSTTTYALATNPLVQENLREEIVQAVKKCPGGKLSYETIMGLKYLDAVMSESLRLYPPAAANPRETVSDYVLETDSKFYKIPSGTMMSILIYAIHHNPDYFKDPETFDPERFMPERNHEIIPYTYLPFGIGPRNCIANRFVLFQLKVCLVYLLQKYRFVRTEETDVPLDFSSSTFLMKAKRIVVGIQCL